MSEHPEAPYDWNPVSEATGEAQSFEPLKALGFDEVVLEVLKWYRSKNRQLEEYQQPNKLMYSLEEGIGYKSVILHSHGDWAQMRTPNSVTFRVAKLIRFDGEDRKFRIRFMLWRHHDQFNEEPPRKELVDMMEVDYDPLVIGSGVTGLNQAAMDIINHILTNSMEFSLYRRHPEQEPAIMRANEPMLRMSS